MDPDLMFVLGGALAVLMVPAILSAIVDGRTPRTPALVALIAGTMIFYAISERPSAYTIGGYPDTAARVISKYLN